MVCEASRSRTCFDENSRGSKSSDERCQCRGLSSHNAERNTVRAFGHTTAEDEVLRWCCCCGYLVLGLASGLEAFSREPPCDSIGALAVRQTPETSGMAREFLSYYPLLPSRYLRDPFTISLNSPKRIRGWIGNSLSTVVDRTALPSTRRLRRPKNGPQFALREYLSQFPAK